MGWLRDLIDQSDSGCRSYGDLARAALESRDWPDESRMNARSLASIFSKLDRNQEADWLAGRQGVQLALSKVLGVPLDDVRAPSTREGPGSDVRRLRLEALPDARALELAEEPLCPGLPSAALIPAAYRNTFWRAPSGSGRSLVGRLLRSRGLAHVIEADDFESALRRLPERGPVFIELLRQRAPLPNPPRPDLCVAGDFFPRNAAWQAHASPPVESYLDELVSWVKARLPSDGRFDAERTLLWLSGEAREQGLVDGLGAALALCGLSDAWGIQSLLGRTPRKIAEKYCRERLSATLDPDAAHGAWLKRNGYDVLSGIGRRLLADSDDTWDEPRSLESWLELVPEEHRREADIDWMRLSLRRADSAIRPVDIEKAARKIPPGAFRIVRALQQAQLLRSQPSFEGDAPRLAFGPRWFSNALRADATRALASGAPEEFGAALLRGHAAPDVARELVARLSDHGSAFIDSVLELESPESASHAAAVEMTFRAAGIAVLEGAELSADSLEALWNEALVLHLELDDDLPCPRIEYPEPEREALLTRGVWYLAALALSGELSMRAGRRHALLRPWTRPASNAQLCALCARIARDLPSSLDDRPWALAAFSLIGRLRAEIGALGSVERPEFLEQPSVILDEVLHGVLSFATVAKVAENELGLPAVMALAKERGLDFSDVARAIWEAWDDAQRPSEGAAFLAPNSAHANLFWPHIPADLLEALLCDARATGVPYELFVDEHWRAFSSALDTAKALAQDARAFMLAPDFVIERALESGVESAALFESVWQRAPDLAVREVSRALDDADASDDKLARLRRLLDCAASRHFARLALLFERREMGAVSRPKLALVRRFLHDYVAQRKLGYPQAYALLSEIEQRLRRENEFRSS